MVISREKAATEEAPTTVLMSSTTLASTAPARAAHVSSRGRQPNCEAAHVQSPSFAILAPAVKNWHPFTMSKVWLLADVRALAERFFSAGETATPLCCSGRAAPCTQASKRCLALSIR